MPPKHSPIAALTASVVPSHRQSAAKCAQTVPCNPAEIKKKPN